jgi:hypothetical protein
MTAMSLPSQCVVSERKKTVITSGQPLGFEIGFSRNSLNIPDYTVQLIPEQSVQLIPEQSVQLFKRGFQLKSFFVAGRSLING